MLAVEELNAFYGKSHIIQGISLHVADGEVVGLLGRNGVGKTTLLRAVLGLTPPKKVGRVKLDENDISELPAHRMSEFGLGYVPQGRRIFPRLTVLENLLLPVTKGKAEQSHLDEVFSYFPRLKERLKQPGSTLSGGEQQMLAIGRAMMARPKFMIIDEPTEGLQPSIVQAVCDSIKSLCQRGITVLIADQNLNNVLELCKRVYVLEKGIIRYEERQENLSIDILHQYLGVKTGSCDPVRA
jgi:branched-chain amino acid transport system ATP-binding protein